MQERFEIGVSEQVSQGEGEGGGGVLAPAGDGLITTESVQSVGFGLLSAKESGNDEVILQEHEEAMQRLEELQREMIGGEKTGTLFSDVQKKEFTCTCMLIEFVLLISAIYTCTCMLARAYNSIHVHLFKNHGS